MRKKICAMIAILSFIYILGTAGSSDLELISFAESIARIVPSTAAFATSLKIGGFI